MDASEKLERRIDGSRVAFDQALIVCGVELARAVRGADNVSTRRSIEAMVRSARQADMPPERALAAFKKMLNALPEIDRLPLPERNAASRRFVQLAIDAYYENNPA